MSHGREGIVGNLRRLGLDAGTTVLIHSSFKSLGAIDGGPVGFLEALIECVGETGTLIFPTFNFDFCKGKPFDDRLTPSTLGILSETARLDPRAYRVPHPIYSFSVIGYHGEVAARIRNVSSFGADSLLGWLRAWDAKIMLIGVTYNDSMTYFHHVEEICGCKHRYMKGFDGWVVRDGQQTRMHATMLVRDLDAGVITAVDPMGAMLEQEGLVRFGRVGGADVKLMDARDVFESTARHLSDEPSLLYRIER